MNISYLRTYVTLAKNGNISQTAVLLGYSKSTIYDQLKSLESELGTKLYQRVQHGITFTDKGMHFLTYAAKMLHTYDEAMNKLSSPKDTLRIGASESSDFIVFNELIKDYIAKFPDVDIEYSKMTTDVSLEKITQGNCDVCLICEPEFHSAEVNCNFLCRLPLLFVASPEHPVLKRGLKSTLSSNTLFCTMSISLVTTMLGNMGIHFDESFSALKNVGNLMIIKEFACNGSGIAILPAPLIKDELSKGHLKVIPELQQGFHFNIYILTPKNKENPAVESFVSLAYEVYKEN